MSGAYTFYASGKLELWDAGKSDGLMLEVRFSTGDGRGEDAACVELDPAEAADLHQALGEWLKKKTKKKDKKHGS